MSAISSSFLPPSNRRRCVKGRPSYAEPIDFLLSSSANQEHNDDFSQSEYSFMDPAEPEEVEEDITIDLSAFLNENPLLAQSAFESAAENNIASTECSSQFRVTDCEVKPSEISETGGIDELSSVCVTGTTTENKNTAINNIVPPVLIDTASTTCDSAKENCLSPEKIFTKISISPTKDIAINGKKSPLKKFPRARPLGLSNPLKKYKNFMKTKDLNKVNEKFFGKYPVVKCEKLDIENLVKNNKIKVGNWPLLVKDSQNNKLVNKNNKKLGLTKTLKPKFMRKPISFNKSSKNSNKSPNNNIHSILIDKFDTVSRPIIIKTDTWKPGVRNSNPVPTFFRSFISNPSAPSKTAVYDLLKPNGNNQIISFNSSPEKQVEKAVFTHTNKIFNRTKSYQFIAPKLHTPDIVNLAPQYPKPVTESLIEPVADNYTVIEPYIEDPFVPQKPKPIITVPIEVLSSPEKLSPSTCPDLIAKESNSETVENKHVLKSVFPKKFSVFRSASDEVDQRLNFSPQNKKDISVGKKSGFDTRRLNRENILNRKNTNACSSKEKAESSKEDSSILKAKNVVVDAMQNAFSSLQQKKKHKPVKKDYFNSSYSSILSFDTSSYSSILNDNLLHGFSEADFEDVSISTENNTSLTYDMLAPPKESSSKIWNNSAKKRKSINENSPYTSDTLSASECEIEKIDYKKSLVIKEASTKRRKKLSLSTSGPVQESKNEMLDTSVCVSNGIVPSEILNDQDDNKISLKHVESSLSLSNVENPILKFNDDAKNDVYIPSENNKLETHDTSLDESLNIHSTPNKKSCTVSDNLPKQETCTRTLRGRKSSSTEVDKTSENSVRENLQTKNAVEKTKFKSIFSKLKIQMKTPPRSTAKVKIKRKSRSKPEDIIREINTITGGRVVSKVNIKKHKKQNSEINKISDSSDINIKEDSESNSLHFKSNRHSSRSLSRKKALKVCIKKSKKKNSTPRLKMKLSSLPDAVENATSENSLSDNNINVHSSFREREVCSIGTLQTKENSVETGTEISDCKMEAQEEKSTPEEPMPVNEEPMVKSSEYFEDSCTSDLNNSVSDSSLLIKCKDDESLPNDSLIASEFILTNGQELNVNDEEKSNVSSTNILENAIDNTRKTEDFSLPVEGSSNEINGNAFASDEQLSIRDDEPKSIDDNSNSDNLVKETNSTSEKESDFDDVDHYENDISTDSNVFDNNLADTLNKIEDNIAKASDVPLRKISENCATVIEEKLNLIKDREIDESSTVHDEIHMNVNDNMKDTQVPHIEGPNSSASEFKIFETSNNVTNTDDRYLFSIEESKNSTLESVNAQEVMIDSCSHTKEKEAGVPCIKTPERSPESKQPSNVSDISESLNDVIEDDSLSFECPSSPRKEHVLSERESKQPSNVSDIPESLNDVIKDDSLSVESPSSETNSCSPRKQHVIGERESKQPSNVSDIPESLNDVTKDDSLSLESPSSETNSCSLRKEHVIGERESKQPSNVSDIPESLNDVIKDDSLSLESPSSETNSCSPRKEHAIGERKSKQPSNVSDISESLNDVIKDDSLSLESSSETNSCSPRKEHVTGERKSRRKRQKKCPKIRISIKKHDGKSPESLKNWFISESKKSDESDDVPEKDSENIISDSLNPCNGIDSVPNTSQDTTVESKISAPLSHDKQLSDLHEISLEKTTEGKTDDSFPGDNSQVDNELTTKEKSVEKNNSCEDDVSKSNLEAKESPKSPSSDKNQLDSANKMSSNNPEAENYFDSSIEIKEEPIDYDENLETYVSAIESASKKKRGRPRKSSIIFAPKISNKKINSNKEVKTSTPKPSPALTENKQQDDTLSPEDIKPSINELQLASKISTPLSGGRKKKITTPGSNASSNRKKNYDPELVIVPLLKGWSREHVIRSTDKQDKKQSDIYYHAPDGKKLRSMPEISAYLSKHPDMQLSTQHFTFAKELVYRPPFEHERYAHARAPIPKTVTPNNIKTSNSPSNKSINVSKGSLKDRSDLPSSTSGSSSKQNKPVNVKPSSSSPMKKTLKRRRSSLKAIDVCTIENSPVPPIKIKQERIDNYFVKESQTSRSSRKIIKKVPFDNSFENMFPKRPKQIPKSQESSKSSKFKNVSGSFVSDKPKSSKEVIKENEQLSGQSPKVNLPSTTNSCEIPVSKPIPENSSKRAPGQPIPERTKIQASHVKKTPKEKFKKRAQLLMAKPCTKFCNFASVLVPTIQCSICLCLFHRECVPFKPIGLTRYACVPCVGMRLTPSSAEEIVQTTDFDIDIELFYPHIDLQITTDLEFNATFNKFYSPVDPSFLTSQDSSNISHSQLPQIITPSNSAPKYTYYSWSNTFNPPPRYDSSLPKNLGPISFNARNYRLIRAAPRFQSTPGCNLNVYGTMPLQKFTNAYFVPNQSPNSAANNRPRNVPILPSGKNAIPCYPNSSLTSNVSFPQGKNAVVYQVPRHNLLADKLVVLKQQNSKVQSGFSQGNTSVLKTILESVSGLAESSKVSSTSVIPEISASAETAQKMGHLSVCVKQENNNLDTADLTSISALETDALTNVSNSEKNDSNKRTMDDVNNVASTSVLETDSLTSVSNSEKIDSNKRTMEDVHNDDSLDKNSKKIKSVESSSVLETDSLINVSNSKKSDSNKRTIDDVDNDDSLDKNAKKLKSDQSAEIKNLCNVSEHVQKNTVQKNRDSTTFWNINKFSQIYECLNLIFKYLSIPDLLRASLVCRSWNHLATQKLLWEDACFSGISVKDWKKCCFTLQKYGTQRLDLRGINNQDSISRWESFSENIIKLCEVEELIFDKVPPFVINKIADTLPQLKRLICYCVTTVFTEPAIWSTPCEFELSTLRFLGRLEILKISSMGGINTINRQKSLMPYIPNLTHVVLTGFKFSSYMNLECLIQMQQLVTLELGDCMEIEPQIYGILAKLTTVQNLCLQNGGHTNCKKMPDAISNMKKLKTLELMNFKISAHLPNVLKKMDSLLHLSLWPDNRSEAAQVHFNSFEAAMSCTNLKSLCWGILTDDDEQDDTVPNALELTDSSGKESRTLSAQELFQSLVERYPRKKVELKSLPRSAWSEYCSSRSYV